jgi:hypothetical protein
MSINPEKADARAAARDARKEKRGAAKEGEEDKKLRIASGVVSRLTKELESYKKEIVAQEARIKKLAADPAYDQSRLPQEEASLQESVQMLPNVAKKITAAVASLATLLEDESFTLAVTKGLDEAKALVAQYSKVEE